MNIATTPLTATGAAVPALALDEGERVLAVVGPHLVLDECQPVHWRDGSRIGLYRVAALNRDVTFLRATRGADALWRVFDLRAAVPDLAREYGRLPRRDWPGLVSYGLRTGFADGAAFIAWLQLQQPQGSAPLGAAADARSVA